jgi:aminoglycoside phosphotransferase (APT) family kinase protein
MSLSSWFNRADSYRVAVDIATWNIAKSLYFSLYLNNASFRSQFENVRALLKGTAMSDETGVQGTMADSVRNAKAKFATINENRLRTFIEAQPGVRGPVTMSALSYPSDGAGASNGIAFFSATLDCGSGLEALDLVLRYSPGTQLLKQKSYSDEFKTLQALADTGLPVPTALWLDADGSMIGSIGYVMTRVVGETPSAAMYSKGPLAGVTDEARKELMLKAAGFHGALRKAAIGGDRVPHLVGAVATESDIEREVNWWFREVLMVWDASDPKAQKIAALRNWLILYQPRDLYSAGLVHGDAQIANIIYRDGEIAAVIDWELSYLGHNESDLALICFLTDVQKLLDVHVDGTPSDEDYILRYEQESGCKVEHWRYFQLMNLYRVVAVSSLSAEIMPSFEAVWAFYEGHMEAAWSRAKDIYEEHLV